MESKKPDRRDFLATRTLRVSPGNPSAPLGSAGIEQQLASEPTSEFLEPSALGKDLGCPSEASSGFVQHFTHRAMGSDFQILLNFGQYRQAAEASLAAFELLDAWENRLSIFRPQSDISRINLVGADTPVVVPIEVFQLLRRAQSLSVETGGAFDITTTPLSRAWGFLSRKPAVPSAEWIESAKALVGPMNMKLNDFDSSVQLVGKGVEINLHGIGKGAVIDRMRELLRSFGLRDFVVHGGQSSASASGASNRGASDTRGWRVGLTHPLFPEQRIAEFDLCDRSLGTSGSARQGLVFEGRRLGHILNPRTGWPAENWLSTTVIHPDSATCDALATAFYVMSDIEVADYCQKNPEVSAILIRDLEKRPRLELVTVNLRQDLMLCESFRHLSVSKIEN